MALGPWPLATSVMCDWLVHGGPLCSSLVSSAPWSLSLLLPKTLVMPLTVLQRLNVHLRYAIQHCAQTLMLLQ